MTRAWRRPIVLLGRKTYEGFAAGGRDRTERRLRDNSKKKPKVQKHAEVTGPLDHAL